MAKKGKAVETKAKQAKPYIHIDEYFSSKSDLESDIKFAFKAYMRAKGQLYHYSVEDFDKALEEFFNRKI